MTVFSLLGVFYISSLIFALSTKCEQQSYNVCRFVREGESCDYKKFDSHGDEPCVIGRKAGLTRINGVKVRIGSKYFVFWTEQKRNLNNWSDDRVC